jgi:hypothetical protein
LVLGEECSLEFWFSACLGMEGSLVVVVECNLEFQVVLGILELLGECSLGDLVGHILEGLEVPDWLFLVDQVVLV